MGRTPHSVAPVTAYYGCDRSVGETVLAGKEDLRLSFNDYDWLGSGVYFWVGSAARALDWARALAQRKESHIHEPFVIGALIYPQHCLNLTDYDAISEVRDAYDLLKEMTIRAGMRMPENTLWWNGTLILRTLDCAVINMVHQARQDKKRSPYDSIYGVFEEGGEIYPGAALRSKTHVQIAVRTMDCIVGYFRVPKIGESMEQDRAA